MFSDYCDLIFDSILLSMIAPHLQITTGTAFFHTSLLIPPLCYDSYLQICYDVCPQIPYDLTWPLYDRFYLQV